jgi:tetratricopeptide (TPR) repeat protein
VIGVVVLALLAGARTGEGAAPPMLPGRLRQDQLTRLAALQRRGMRAVDAGHFAEALRLGQEILESRQRWQGSRHWQVVDTRLEVEHSQRLVKLPRDQQQRLGEVIRLGRLGAEMSARGRHREAEKVHREALAICRKVLGEDHPNTALRFLLLGQTLAGQGKNSQAQPLYEKAVAIWRQALGEEHPETALGYDHLASCREKQGKPADALLLSEKALAINRKALGEDHPRTASSYVLVGYCLYRQARHADALPRYEKALAIRRKLLGEEHIDTAASYTHVAACLHLMGKLAEALPLHQKVLAIRRKVQGEEHLQTADAYHLLASTLAVLGKLAEALPLSRKALAIRRKVLGEEHSSTASSYHNLASCLEGAGRLADALPLQEKALAINRKILGEENASTARSYSHLADCLEKQGKHGEALILYEKALAIYHKVLGAEHLDTASGCMSLASCLDQQGKHADALPLHRKGLAIHLKALSEEHPHTATSYRKLAICLQRQGKLGEALPLFRKALAIHRKVLGEEIAATASSYDHLAICLGGLGKHAEALPLHHKALAIYRKALGEKHPYTASSYTNLAACLYKLGKYDEAIRCWQGALLVSDVGRRDSATSGFDRSLFMARALTPRSGLAVTYTQRKEGEKAWQCAESALARGLLDDLGASGLQMSRQTPPHATGTWPLARIQKQIPADGALVFWLDTLDEHWACVLRREGPPHWQRLPGSRRQRAWSQDDWHLPARLYQALKDRNVPASRRDRLVQEVRQQRLEPLRDYLRAQGSLPAVQRLFVVPTNRMARVPVEVLAPQYTVSYVPSGTILARLMEQHRGLSVTSLLALGHPVFAQAARRLAEPPRHGLLARFVQPGSNAYRAGIRAGDVLLNYRGTDLHSLDDLDSLLAQPDSTSAVRWRNGDSQTVTLQAGPLGITFDSRSARAAVRAWQRAETPMTRSEYYQPLPGTRIEVAALRRLVGSRQSTYLLGSLASEEQLDRINRGGSLRQYRLLHFATHGHIDEDSPVRSALILSRDHLPDPLEQARSGRKVQDGRLTVQTILTDWRLDADLVVLSACETALGKDAGGNGLLGFAHAFLARGARSVVLSRWKVDDTATALLMVRFYENLLGKRQGLSQPLPRAEALAEAKRWLRELSRQEATRLTAELSSGVLEGTSGQRGKVVPLNAAAKKAVKLPEGERPFAHPFFWAAFVLIGDPD